MGSQRDSYTINCEDYAIKKKTASIDVKDMKNLHTGNNSFKRLEYWGVGSYFLLHYPGDHTFFVQFKHRNSKKNTKPFVKSAPFIKEKVRIVFIL